MKDLFSNHASAYAAFRPTYPPSLYDYILKNTSGRIVAWDCACGNGQVARDLALNFKTVHATDISQQQINSAYSAVNIIYSLSSAESTTFADQTFDLITVGQALHWFKMREFFIEAKRVGKPGSTIAVWGYGLLRVNKGVDTIMDDFYFNLIGPYWETERRLIDEHYATVAFPFKKIPAPAFDFSFQWTLAELRGYLSTWSAVRKFIHERKVDPVPEVIARIAPFWKNERERVSFPLFVLLGRR